MKKLTSTTITSIVGAFTCGVAYEYGRTLGKKIPAMSPKEFMAGYGGQLLQANMRERAKAERDGDG